MMEFWIVAGILLAIALAFVLPPLLRQRESAQQPARAEINISIYRDQLAELEKDLENNTISREQYDQAREDLERGLLTDVAASNEPAEAGRGSLAGRAPAVVVAVVIPVLAVSLYNVVGGGAPALEPEKTAPQVVTNEHVATIENMVEGLAQRLQDEPENVEGWFMLGRSYLFLQRYEDAKAAFDKVMQLGGGDDPDFLATYADVLAILNNRRIAGPSLAMIERALQLNPFHIKALWLAGTAAYQESDFNRALKYWERLAEALPAGSEDQNAVRGNIAEVRAKLGQGPVAPAPSSVASAAATQIKGRVELDGGLAAKVSPEDTVFIFARAANGPRMPLAIVRKQVKDLPLDFTLDDSMAMNPAMKLSGFAQVVVGARVSKSGNAMPQAGDLQGFSGTLNVADSGPVRITIGQVIQ